MEEEGRGGEGLTEKMPFPSVIIENAFHGRLRRFARALRLLLWLNQRRASHQTSFSPLWFHLWLLSEFSKDGCFGER